MEQQEQPARAKWLKIVIIVLAVLLVLSAGGLAARYLYLHFAAPAQTTAEVPDNLIGEEPESSSEEIPGASDRTESSHPTESGESGRTRISDLK